MPPLLSTAPAYDPHGSRERMAHHRRPNLVTLMLRAATILLSLLALPGCATRGGQHEGSDGGWAVLTAGVGAIEVEHYDDLPAMSRAADLVVLATIDSVSAGRTFTSARDATDVLHYVSLNLRVDEVLGGAPDQAPDTLLSLQTERAGPEQIAELDGQLSGQRGLFFLRQVTDFGDGLVTHPTPGPVYRLVSSQGVVSAGADGEARVPTWLDEGFPADLAGRDFSAVVEETRQHARA